MNILWLELEDYDILYKNDFLPNVDLDRPQMRVCLRVYPVCNFRWLGQKVQVSSSSDSSPQSYPELPVSLRVPATGLMKGEKISFHLSPQLPMWIYLQEKN